VESGEKRRRAMAREAVQWLGRLVAKGWGSRVRDQLQNALKARWIFFRFLASRG